MNNINKNYLIIGGIVLMIITVIIVYILGAPKQEEINNYQDLEISETKEEKEEEAKEKIKIHIAGSVVDEGIVELEEGARIADAIEAAGGTTLDANMQKINLAYKLQDGQKIYIPNQNEDEEEIEQNLGIIQNTEESTTNTIAGKININTAKQTELELLTGIGPSTATKIIEYRNTNGKFKTIEDIKNVPGIGEAKYESIKEQITV